MFTAKTPFCEIVSEPSVPLITQTRTRGGSSETDVNEVAVIPYGSSGPRVVMTVTPVQNVPRALRNSRASNTDAAGFALACCTGAELVQPLLDDSVEVLGRAERLGDEAAERVAVHREQRRRCDGLHGRGARHVAQDRHLAEELTAFEGGDAARLSVVLSSDFDLAVDDDEELVRRSALADDHRSGVGLHGLQRRRDRAHLLARQVVEDRVDD